MADITNPVAINNLNAAMRPLSEDIRALKARIDSERAQYDGGVGDHFFGHGSDNVVDPEHPGALPLTGNDVLAWVQLILYDLKALLDAAGAESTVEKLCIRQLEAT